MYNKKPTYKELEHRLKEAEKIIAALRNQQTDTFIFERKQSEKNLLTERDFSKSIVETAQVIILVLDTEGEIVGFNPYMEELSGYQLHEVQGKDWFSTFLPPCDYDRIREVFKRALNNIHIKGNENPIITKDGREKIIEWYNKTLKDEQGNTVGILAIGHDITDRKKAEKQCQRNLKEKEILLRELYHRTKNNMQVICSMLRIRAAHSDDQSMKGIFQEIENKIHAMALVHKHLFESQDLSLINLKDYFNSLLALLKKSYSDFMKNISIHTGMDDINVLIDTAVPMGLIFNELISNAVKHAFPNNAPGEIMVNLNVTPQNEIILEGSDNGIGLPSGFDIRKDIHLGLETVFELVEHQLDSTIIFENRNGLHWKILLEKELYKPRI
ncbi:MAG: sensor histidine kinase [bacterium]